jgi:hypothetical protein
LEEEGDLPDYWQRPLAPMEGKENHWTIHCCIFKASGVF